LRARAAAHQPPASLAGLELLASAVVVLDCDGRIVYANAAAENLLESSLKALSRQTLSALFLNTEELTISARRRASTSSPTCART
jgi:two-component system nitrogen regulation sensor histidine kinase GlnL